MNIRCDISTNGSDSLLLSHHSIKCAWYLLKQILFPWLPSTEVFSSISLCCLFISKGWRIWTLWKVNFWIPRVAHWSEARQSSEKDIKMLCSVTLLKDKCFRCICPWWSNRNLLINIIPHLWLKNRFVLLTYSTFYFHLLELLSRR